MSSGVEPRTEVEPIGSGNRLRLMLSSEKIMISMAYQQLPGRGGITF
jgi:hypothetical protein